MTFRRYALSCLLAGSILGSATCSVGGSTPPRVGKVHNVYVNVGGWELERIAAVLADRNGRRSGWTTGGVLREIAGAQSEYGVEDGIPLNWDLPDSLQGDETADTTWYYGPPRYVFFTLHNDAVTPVGLIDEGECELRVDPIVGGRLHLAIVATGDGFNGCEDTTSVWAKPGVPQRWRLTWRALAGRCVVKITRIAAGKSGTRSAR